MFGISPWLFSSMAALVVAAGVLVACGGSVEDSKGEGVEQEGSGGSEASSAGGRSAAGGARTAGGTMSAGGVTGAGGAIATGGAVVHPDGGLPVCPIREPGTLLTASQCHACIPAGTPCTSPGSPLPPIQIDAEGCVRVIEMQTTLYCVWYETREQYNQVWGAVSLCDSNPGIVACGGGI